MRRVSTILVGTNVELTKVARLETLVGFQYRLDTFERLLPRLPIGVVARVGVAGRDQLVEVDSREQLVESVVLGGCGGFRSSLPSSGRSGSDCIVYSDASGRRRRFGCDLGEFRFDGREEGGVEILEEGRDVYDTHISIRSMRADERDSLAPT